MNPAGARPTLDRALACRQTGLTSNWPYTIAAPGRLLAAPLGTLPAVRRPALPPGVRRLITPAVDSFVVRRYTELVRRSSGPKALDDATLRVSGGLPRMTSGASGAH